MTATLTRKTLAARVQIKDADQGIVELAFARFNKIDGDGDVTLKGAFAGNPPVVLSAYGHKSWDGALPYGTGTIREGDVDAIAEVKFELDTTHGRDAFLIVKALSEAGLQEWSYSLENVESERGTVDGKSVRILRKIFVKEISPVLRGAGTDTRTLDVKAERKQLMSMVARMLDDAGRERFDTSYGYSYLDDFDLDEGFAVFCVVSYESGARERRLVQIDYTRDATSVTLGEVETEVETTTVYLPKGSKFSEHFDFALRGVKQLTEMAVERLTLRAAEGKSISEQVEAHDALTAALAPLKAAIDATQPPPDDTQAAVDAAYLEFVAHSQGVNA